MTRHIICREGIVEKEVNNTLIEFGALRWDEGKVPLTWNFGRGNPELNLLGYAEDLRREENGDITAELTFLRREEEIHAIRDSVGATIFASSVVEKQRKGVRVVSGAKVREVTVTLHVPWRLSDWELPVVEPEPVRYSGFAKEPVGEQSGG